MKEFKWFFYSETCFDRQSKRRPTPCLKANFEVGNIAPKRVWAAEWRSQFVTSISRDVMTLVRLLENRTI